MISMFCMYQHSRRICNDSASRTSNNYGIGVGEKKKLNSTNHNLKTVMMRYEDGKPLRVKGKKSFLGRKKLREMWIQLKIQEEEDLNTST
jgi:hypothetical protein